MGKLQALVFIISTNEFIQIDSDIYQLYNTTKCPENLKSYIITIDFLKLSYIVPKID